MRCYFDGSKGVDGDNNVWLTLAGYVAKDGFWRHFNTQWDRMLRERYPVAPYVHMYQLASGSPPFESGPNGWTKAKVEQLIHDALGILQVQDKEVFRSVICSVNVAAHARLVDEGYEIEDPAVLCVEACVGQAFDWFLTRYGDSIELAYLHFDRDEPFIKPIRDRWLPCRPIPGKVTSEPFWGLIQDILPVPMDENPAVQAADMLAWARTRSLVPHDRPWRYLADMMRAVIPQSGVFVTEAIMRSKYSMRRP